MIWILKATAVLAVLFGVSALLRRASAAHRHLVWGVGLAALLAVPLISYAVPWEVAILPPPATTAPMTTPAGKPSLSGKPAHKGDAAAFAVARDNAGTPITARSQRAIPPGASSPVTWRAWLWALWVTGGVLVMLRVLIGLAGAWGMRRAARPMNDAGWNADLAQVSAELSLKRRVELLATDAPVMPFTVGLMRPAVVVPAVAASWTPAQRLDVLRHELAHIERHDGLWHLVGHAACAVYWFHPLVWQATRRLRAECERACDAIVLAGGTRPSAYAQPLLDIVRRADAAAVPQAVLAMARRSEFEGRLLAILEHRVTEAATETHAEADVETITDVRATAAANTTAPTPAQSVAPSLATALVARIDDPDARVREEIVRALARHGDTTTINALARALRTDTSPAVRRTARL